MTEHLQFVGDGSNEADVMYFTSKKLFRQRTANEKFWRFDTSTVDEDYADLGLVIRAALTRAENGGWSTDLFAFDPAVDVRLAAQDEPAVWEIPDVFHTAVDGERWPSLHELIDL